MGIKFQDYYEVLGIPRDAGEKDIKAAYRKLARKYHPDLHSGDEKAAAEEKFKQINEAHEVLSDPEKRAKYDRLGQNWQSGDDFRPHPDMDDMHFYSSAGQESGFSDFFETIFGGFRPGYDAFGGQRSGRQQQRRGSDVEAELSLTLEEAYHGGEKTIQLNAPQACPHCGGSGISGNSFCPGCAGTGQTQAPRTLTVKVPPGTRDGSKIRLRGQGDGPEGQRGDLYLKVRILPHQRYKVKGEDLEAELPISPWQAVLGDKVAAESLDGRITVTVPPGTRTGKKLRLRGKGLRKKTGQGDLYLRVVIDIPQNLSEEETELYRRLAAVHKEQEVSA
ncbi:J domain-containing protein [Dethiobacter alkaliphilus]|uniref:J domain-containing protein n=1 Tax=Dethiobacter alkaliphilus TaxID=427926 RepID=UPI002227DDED|nr:J domain-containing protein [Dethiobacter alkaliphilus]MCW3490529.1 J domain-containing protein [Dethiobacter alkaliphilus]